MVGLTYKDAGVDDDKKRKISKTLHEAARTTWGNRRGKFGEIVEIFPGFSGLRGIRIWGPENGFGYELYSGDSSDGVGTKSLVAELVGKYDTLGYDLAAMVVDDCVRWGLVPVYLSSIIDVNTMNPAGVSIEEIFGQVARGYRNAANEAGIGIMGGETAELGFIVGGYGEFKHIWGAHATWFGRKDRMLVGDKLIKPGDKIVGLKEEGFRSNGFSLVRKVFENELGPEWYETEFEGKKLGEQVLAPSKIYCATIVDMFGDLDDEPKAEIHGIAHITGGGIPEKLGRVFGPYGLGANISHPYEPSSLTLYCQELGKVSDEEAYKTWNMGQGMVVITPEPDKVIEVAKSHKIDAKEIGYIHKYPGIEIVSGGQYSNGEELYFERPQAVA